MKMTLEQFPHSVEYLPASPVDAEGIFAVQLGGWLTAYVNHDLGITAELINARFANREERIAKLKARIKDIAAGAPDKRLWVAVADGRVIGYCSPLKFSETSGRLGALTVEPEYQGTGVASRLIQLAIDWFGSMPMDLSVVAYNQRALAFYKKFGFVEIGPDTMAIGDKSLPLINMRRG